jgi:two-component system, chemotaxis family, protein-glutamate methylesterase/glutaminase
MAINAAGLSRTIVTIGASAGGVQALMALLSRLPRDLPAAVAIVLHRSPTSEPSDGEVIQLGRIYVAPADLHMTMDDGRFRLHRSAKVHFTRPAADPLFTSAARAYGARVAGVVLSGSGDDGVSGLIAIKAAGGLSFVQDPDEAAYPSMPTKGMLYDHVDAVLPIDGIAAALTAVVTGGIVPEALVLDRVAPAA